MKTVLLTFLLMLVAAFGPVGCISDTGANLRHVETGYAVADGQFARTMSHLLGPPIIHGNRVTAYQNGDETFPAMLETIRKAEKTITFETFIYWSGFIGKSFAEALAERAQAGVRVHVIIDAVGGFWLDSQYIRQMKRAGVEVRFYKPVRWSGILLLREWNQRTHRKLLVIDGKTGFTGGTGIGDEWMGKGDRPEIWRDMHFRLEGPAVAYMQAAFADSWVWITGEVLHGPDYFPPLEEVGSHAAQVFQSRPEGGHGSMQLMYLLSFAAARESILLESAYFVPDSLTLDTLVRAARRGVKVQIITSGRFTDTPSARRAARPSWGRLLEAGAQIYEYDASMFHSKMLIVDDLWVSVGSANLDYRSFRLNSEANLNVLDSDFATEMRRVFEADLARSNPYTYGEWLERSALTRAGDWVLSLFKKQF